MEVFHFNRAKSRRSGRALKKGILEVMTNTRPVYHSRSVVKPRTKTRKRHELEAIQSSKTTFSF